MLVELLDTIETDTSYILDFVQQINQIFPNNSWRLVQEAYNSFRIINITETEAEAIAEFFFQIQFAEDQKVLFILDYGEGTVHLAHYANH